MEVRPWGSCLQGTVAAERQGRPHGRGPSLPDMLGSTVNALLITFVFAIAAGVNTLSVALQQERHWFTRHFGEQAWYVHLVITTPIWGLFLVLQGRLGSQVHWSLAPELELAGMALAAVGVALLLATLWQLGLTRTFNGYFFGRGRKEPVSGGVFRWLRNPMYDSFWILFVAEAFWLGHAIYLVLAAESFILLNQIEARVENRPFRADPRPEPAPPAGPAGDKRL